MEGRKESPANDKMIRLSGIALAFANTVHGTCLNSNDMVIQGFLWRIHEDSKGLLLPKNTVPPPGHKG